LDVEVKVYRSRQRKKTVAARFTGTNELMVYLPDGLTQDEEQKWIERMLSKVEEREQGKGVRSELDFLLHRTKMLNKRYFDGALKYESIRYVSNQTTCAGSCSISTRRIRISERIARMPVWVLDYVIIHELSHLLYPDHSSAFWQCVNRYPLTERARGYLMACNMEPGGAA
jgi:predicted metal-dependent hydrolase